MAFTQMRLRAAGGPHSEFWIQNSKKKKHCDKIWKKLISGFVVCEFLLQHKYNQTDSDQMSGRCLTPSLPREASSRRFDVAVFTGRKSAEDGGSSQSHLQTDRSTKPEQQQQQRQRQRALRSAVVQLISLISPFNNLQRG